MRIISIKALALSYTKQLVIPYVCTKFQNPRCSSSEVVTKNLMEKKETWTNKGNDKHENDESGLHDTSSPTQCLYQILKS